MADDVNLSDARETIISQAAAKICEVGALCGWPGPDCKSQEAAEALYEAGLLRTLPSLPSDIDGLVEAKVEEIEYQLDTNVEIAKRDHPENGPLPHSQDVLAGHIRERLDELRKLIAALRARQAPELPLDRETLGRMVREAWVRWAKEQPNPKPSWLVPYDDLSEADKEADRQIGETIAKWTVIHSEASCARQAPEGVVDEHNCPICDEPFKIGDQCSTDIELGMCHADCLEGSSTVNLDTGEPSDGPIATYLYEPDDQATSALGTLSQLVELVANDVLGESVADCPDDDSVGWNQDGPVPMTFGHVRRAQQAIGDLRAALSAMPSGAVKELDLSNLLKHAFLSGVVAARSIPPGDECDGPALWVDYDPEGCPAFARIRSALDGQPS